MLGLSASISKAAASMRSYVKDNLKLYLDFKSNKSDTLKFPCEGSTSFDGSNDGIDTGNIFSGGETQATFSAWIWADESGGSTDKLVGQTDESGNAADPFIILWSHSSNAIQFWFSDGAGTNYRYIASSAVTADTWHHLACTADLSTGVLKMYLDGVDLGLTVVNNASPPSSVAANTTTNYIGQGRSTGGDMWKGKVANMAIWTRVLSLEEINSVMRKNYSQLKSVEKTSLVSWWALDEDINPLITNRGLVVDSHGFGTTGSNMLTSINSTDWTANHSYAVINNSNATFDYDDGGTGTVDNTNQTTRIMANENYKMTFTISGLASGVANLKFYDMGNSGIGEVANFANGTHTNYAWGLYDNQRLRIGMFNASSGSFSMSDVEMVKLTGNNGRITGATTTTSVYGGNAPVLPRSVDVAREGEAEAIGDGSASFTASNADYIQIADNNIFSENLGFSVACWVKFDSISGDTCIISKHADYGDVDNDGEFYIINDDGACDFVVVDHTNSASKGQIKTSAFAVDTWYHLACTYDGGTTNGGCKIYINGIFQTQSDNASGSGFAGVDNTSQPLRIGAFADDGEPHDGNISQVGFWQGVLTQAQIQSLMESTSYAKIPASVKSTLGAELITNGSFDTDSGWTKGDGWTIADGVASSDETAQSTHSYLAQSVSFESGALYRVSYDLVYNDSAGNGFQVQFLGSGTSAGTGRTSSGSYVEYITSIAAHTTFNIRSSDGTATGTIDNISVKKVTNDLVGYWALDEVQTSDFSTKYEPDSLGGELGSELFTGWENEPLSSGVAYKGWSSFTTSGQTVTASQADEGAVYNKVFHTETFSVVAGTAYEINMTVDSRSNVYIRGFTSTSNSEGGTLVSDLLWMSLPAGVNKYVVLANTTSSSAMLHVRQHGGNTASITISAISIKPLSGNYGRLL